MLAVPIHHHGGRDALSLDEIPVPDIGPDALLVKAVASSIDPVDWKVREGYPETMIPPGGTLVSIVSPPDQERARVVGKIALYAGTP